jgi:hypothetical protein
MNKRAVAHGHLVIALVPWWIAKSRNHAQSGTVMAMSFVGLVVPPLWLAAMIWAFVGRVREASPFSASAPPLTGSTAISGVAQSPTAHFKVSGVDRESRMDCSDYYAAESAANARAKAELDGMIVTSVEPVIGPRQVLVPSLRRER